MEEFINEIGKAMCSGHPLTHANTIKPPRMYRKEKLREGKGGSWDRQIRVESKPGGSNRDFLREL